MDYSTVGFLVLFFGAILFKLLSAGRSIKELFGMKDAIEASSKGPAELFAKASGGEVVQHSIFASSVVGEHEGVPYEVTMRLNALRVGSVAVTIFKLPHAVPGTAAIYRPHQGIGEWGRAKKATGLPELPEHKVGGYEFLGEDSTFVTLLKEHGLNELLASGDEFSYLLQGDELQVHDLSIEGHVQAPERQQLSFAHALTLLKLVDGKP